MLKLLVYNFVRDEDILNSVKSYIDSLLEDNIICKSGLISGGLGMVAVIYDFLGGNPPSSHVHFLWSSREGTAWKRISLGGSLISVSVN